MHFIYFIIIILIVLGVFILALLLFTPSKMSAFRENISVCRCCYKYKGYDKKNLKINCNGIMKNSDDVENCKIYLAIYKHQLEAYEYNKIWE